MAGHISSMSPQEPSYIEWITKISLNLKASPPPEKTELPPGLNTTAFMYQIKGVAIIPKRLTDVLNGRTDVLNGRTDMLNGRIDVLNGRTDVLNGHTVVTKGLITVKWCPEV